MRVHLRVFTCVFFSIVTISYIIGFGEHTNSILHLLSYFLTSSHEIKSLQEKVKHTGSFSLPSADDLRGNLT